MPEITNVWDHNKTYTGTVGVNGETKPADRVWFMGAYWLANYNNTDVNPAADAGNDPGGAWKLDTTGPAPFYDPQVPQAPTGLTAGYTSDDTISLFWNAAGVWGAGSVSSYNVYRNGVHVGTTTDTNFTVTGLAAGTNYTFTVDASNLYGTSGIGQVLGFNNFNLNQHPSTNPALNAPTEANQTESGKYFSAYVDMTLPANPVNGAIATSDLVAVSKASGLRDFTLGFMQTTVDAGGTPILTNGLPTLSWGGLGTRTPLSTGTIIDEVRAVQSEGGVVSMAFGGFNGQDGAVIAAQRGMTVAQLQNMYQSVISTYGVTHLDFDVENPTTVNNTAANHLRNLAIKGLQAANPDLHVTFTVATTPNGVSAIDASGSGNVLRVFQQAKADGVHIDVVNIMAMDYFDNNPLSERPSGTGLTAMATNAITAAKAVHNQLISLGVDAKIGITPMIGQNDTPKEVFTLADARALEAFASATDWVAGLGEWELPRDNGAGGLRTGQAALDMQVANQSGGVLGSAASSYFSSVTQSTYEFAKIFDAITTHTSTGGAGVDVLRGTDFLMGTNGQVLMTGNDAFHGGAGSDSIVGGTGLDTAIYDGLFRSYAVAGNPTTRTVAGGPEGGTDTVSGVEILKFVDGSVSYDPNGFAAQIMRLYDAVLERAPDAGGLNHRVHQMEHGLTNLRAEANALVASGEFQTRTGTLDNAGFVDFLYRTTLDRQPDAGGRAHWISQLNGGMTRADAVLGFSESAEHIANTLTSVNAGLFIYDESTAAVEYLYDSAFNRYGDAGGVVHWATELDAGRTSLQSIADGFAASSEFQQDIAGMSHRAVVEYMYQNNFGRAADAGGAQHWTSQLDSGMSYGTLILGLGLSGEHVTAMQPAVEQGLFLV